MENRNRFKCGITLFSGGETLSKEEWVEIEVSEETNQKLENFLRELQRKGEPVKTVDDVVTYLFDHQKKK